MDASGGGPEEWMTKEKGVRGSMALDGKNNSHSFPYFHIKISLHNADVTDFR